MPELEGKVAKIQEIFINEIDINESNDDNLLLNDVVSALINLGYKRNEVHLIASKVIKNSSDNLSIDFLIKETLRELSINV